MTETEAKVRCLELAATVLRTTSEYHAKGIVDTAKELYNFVSEQPLVDKKPSKKPDKVTADILG